MRLARIAACIVFLTAASCEVSGVPTSSGGTGQISSVVIAPASVTLFVGGTLQLSVVVRDSNGNVVSGAAVTWSSDDSNIASVDGSGRLSARGAGNTTVRATASGVSGTVSVGVQTPPAGSGDVVVNAGVTFQTMRGWEAHEQSAHEHASFPMFQNELMSRAVDELGLNRVRVEMWSGTEHNADYYTQWLNGQIDDAAWRCQRFATTNDNNDPFNINWNGFHFSKIDKVVNDVVKPLQQRLQARGEQLHINLMYDAFTEQICPGGQYHHDDSPEEFAEFVLANFLHLRDDLGIVAQSFELLLEPNNTIWWGKGRQLGDALVATMARLNANGFSPRVIAPSVAFANMTLGYLDEMGQAPGALSLIDELSYHRYDRPSQAVLQSIRTRASGLGIETSMLEYWRGADQHTLYEDLVHGGVSAWEQFALAFWQAGGQPYNDPGGVYYIIDVQNPGNPQVVMASRARYLSQYFKYVREGAQRVQATTSANGVTPVAFVNPTGKMVMVANVSGSRSFTVGGLAPGTYDITYTTAGALQASGGSVTIGAGESVPVSVPGTGVVTVFGR